MRGVYLYIVLFVGILLSFCSFFFTYSDVYRSLQTPCPTPCLLQVLHFNEITENPRGRATRNPVSQRALDVKEVICPRGS